MVEPNKDNGDPVRVLIVDDHPLVRECLCRLVERDSNFVVCGQAEDRLEALAVALRCQPHLALIDLTLKDSSGLELVRDIAKQLPNVKMLVLSMYDETTLAERAVRAGAHGYIGKQEPLEKIWTAVCQVLRGEIYWSEKAALCVASRIVSRSGLDRNGPVNMLTDREMQVFELIGNGRSTRQIAAALHIGVSTVETYRNRIKQKLNLKDAAELLQSAIHSSTGRNPGGMPTTQ